MNRKPARRPGLSLIERALIEREWHQTAIEAQIHALMGDNSHGMVNAAGRVLFVILGAAAAEEVDPEMPEILSILAAVEAVHDQVDEEEITSGRRETIVAGLAAAEVLIPAFERRSLVNAAIDLAQKLSRQHIHRSDFPTLGRQGATA